MFSLPLSFHHIWLDPVRELAHPAGDTRTGYLITVPLDSDGRIDANFWKTHRNKYRVVRFRTNDRDVGHLVRGWREDWRFIYDNNCNGAEESGINPRNEKFAIGGCVSIREGDLIITYRVISLEQCTLEVHLKNIKENRVAN